MEAKRLEAGTGAGWAGAGLGPHPALAWRTEPRGPRGLELTLAGALAETWCLDFTRALAARGMNLLRGHAHEGRGGWSARLEIDAHPNDRSLDFGRLLCEPVAPPLRCEPRLLDFELAFSPAHDGCLELEVHAWDSIGLLATLLGRARGGGLRPVELWLETEEECAFHRLSLRGIGGRRPALGQARGFARALERLRRAG
jgi:hypothetical protein